MRITSLSSIFGACALVLAACGGSDAPADTTPATDEVGEETAAPAATESGEEATPSAAATHEARAAGTAGMKAHEGEEHQGHQGEEHHHDFPGAVSDFHDVLAPVWHAESGKADKACAASDEFVAQIEAVEAMEAPEDVDAEQWSEAVATLRQEVDGLVAACPGDEPALRSLHEAFHGLVRLVGHEE